jgi:peptide/nickel transport system permease protein
MTAVILRRLFQAIGVVFAMALLVFIGIYAIGNPIDVLAGGQMSDADRAALAKSLALDRPIWEQFGIFLGKLAQGDLGRSFATNEPALRMILDRMPATLELALVAMLISILLGIPLGMLAGLKPNSLAGRSVMVGSILGFSLPTFWVGLMLILIFAVYLGILPATGRGETVSVLGVRLSILTLDGLAHILLPAINLALFKMALVIRLTRAGTREVMLQDYVRYARAKGLSERRVIGIHVLRNILIPVVTVLGLELGNVVAFAVVTERVFAWPGMGKLLIDSLELLDRPVIVAYLIVIVFVFVIINLVVDILYSFLDPRVRLEEAKA